MSIIGRLAVAVLGNIDDFQKNFSEAKKGVKSFTAEVQKGDADLKKMGRNLTLIGTAIIGSMTATTIAVSKSAEEIDMLAKRTGATREELQALGYAAEQEGSSIEALSGGFNKLAKNMYDAVTGNKDAAVAFKDLDINVKNSNGGLRNVTDVLIDLADRVKDSPDETAALALTMKVLGKSAGDMVPFLKMGGDEIRRLMQEAKDLGYVIDEQDIKNMEALGDELGAVKTGFAGIGRQIASDIAPALLDFAGNTKEVFKWFHLLPDDIRKFITQGTFAIGVISTISGGLAILIVRIGALKKELEGLGLSFSTIMARASAFVAVLWSIGAAINAFKDYNFSILKPEQIKNITDQTKALQAQAYYQKEILRIQDEIDKMQKGGGLYAIKRGLGLNVDDLKMYNQQLQILKSQKAAADQAVANSTNPKPAKQPNGNYTGEKDARSAYELAKDQFEIYSQQNRSLEDQFRYWQKIVGAVNKTGKEADDYKKKLAELRNELQDATKKAADDLAVERAKGYQKELLALNQQEEIELKTIGKGSERRQLVEEKYAIQRSKLKSRWDNETKAQQLDLQASLLTAQGDYEKADEAEENAAYARQLNNEDLSDEQIRKINADHTKALLDIHKKFAGEKEAQELELHAAIMENQGNFYQAERDRENANYAQQISAAGLTATQIETINKQHTKNLGDIDKKWAGEKKAQQLELDAATAELQSQFEQAAIDEENANYEREISAANLTNEQKEAIEKKHQKAITDIRNSYADQRAQNQLAMDKAQLDLQITNLENSKDLTGLEYNQTQSKYDQLQIEKQIVDLKIKKIDLDIKELQRQKAIADAAGDTQKSLELQTQILQAQNDKDSLSNGLDIDLKSYYNDINNDLRDGLSSAIQDGFKDGGSAVDSFADYLKQKVRKNLADSLAESIAGPGLQSWFNNLFGPKEGGAAAQNTASGGLTGLFSNMFKGLTNLFHSGTSSAATSEASSGFLGGLGSIFTSLGPTALALTGIDFLEKLFGGGDQSITIKASGATVNADFVAANFKEITLPSSYMNHEVPSSNAPAPVITLGDININAQNTVVTQGELKQYLKDAAKEAFDEIDAANKKWQPMTVKMVTS